jgi:hypothetical protein
MYLKTILTITTIISPIIATTCEAWDNSGTKVWSTTASGCHDVSTISTADIDCTGGATAVCLDSACTNCAESGDWLSVGYTGVNAASSIGHYISYVWIEWFYFKSFKNKIQQYKYKKIHNKKDKKQSFFKMLWQHTKRGLYPLFFLFIKVRSFSSK